MTRRLDLTIHEFDSSSRGLRVLHRQRRNPRYDRFLTACGRPPRGDFSRVIDWKTSDIAHNKFTRANQRFARLRGGSRASKIPHFGNVHYEVPYLAASKGATKAMKIAAEICFYANDKSSDQEIFGAKQNMRIARLGPLRRRRAHARRL